MHTGLKMAEQANQALIRTLIAKGELPTADKVIQEARVVDDIEYSVKVVRGIKHEPGKITVNDFTKQYRNRYNFLKNILLSRPSTADALSIGKISYAGQSNVTIIGMIYNIMRFPTGTIKLEVEDPTGTITAIVSKNKVESIKEADLLSNDEVVALKGTIARKTLFVDEIIWPDVPKQETKRAPEEVYAAFSGDIHAGSNTFMPKQLEKFVNWLNSNDKVARKTKYVFFQGDIVDGIGIYPKQEKELDVTDIYKQYDLAAKFIKQIPSDKAVIICPGNHDAMRLAEPQPPLYKDLAATLYDLPNVYNVSNPCLVNIHGKQFPGFNVLMYHGMSFDYYLNNIEGLRQAGGYDRPDLLLKFLLKRRHLAPTYDSVPSLPTPEDQLLIREVPDIFTTGHIHKAKLMTYQGILGVASSCWQANTSFQDKVGLKAEPARVPIVNMQTRKAQILEFI